MTGLFATGRRAEALRWGLLAVAAVSVTVFVVAQRQSADVTYGNSPARATIAEGSAGELTTITLPSVDRLTAMVAADPVVRLPGSIAVWDEARVRAASGGADVRILVAPAGLSEAQRDQLSDVKNATIRIVGTRVSGGMYQASSSTLAEWRGQFARGDVTGQLVALIRSLQKTSGGEGPAEPAWRDPTAAELGPVAEDLRATGRHIAAGATLTAVPAEAAKQAFGTGDALFVALPVQAADAPAPRFGPRLAEQFPGRPLVVMYGNWVEYFGPHADEFADVVAASFYARFGDRLSAYAYPQDNVLGVYLSQVTDVRYAGLFDRPLPYQPLDPLRVALPVLPWLFAACVALFIALSARDLRRPAAPRTGGVPARLAGLTALAVEVSGLTDAGGDPALTRAIRLLGSAREALDDQLPDRQIRALLDAAERELDTVGRAVGVAGYRPAQYLQGRLA